MLVEKITGGWSVCELIDCQLVRRRYFGYTKREAVREFKAETKPDKGLSNDKK